LCGFSWLGDRSEMIQIACKTEHLLFGTHIQVPGRGRIEMYPIRAKSKRKISICSDGQEMLQIIS
jgi:hypothetical protein